MALLGNMGALTASTDFFTQLPMTNNVANIVTDIIEPTFLAKSEGVTSFVIPKVESMFTSPQFYLSTTLRVKKRDAEGKTVNLEVADDVALVK